MNDWMTQSVTKSDSKIQLTCEELIRQIIHNPAVTYTNVRN